MGHSCVVYAPHGASIQLETRHFLRWHCHAVAVPVLALLYLQVIFIDVTPSRFQHRQNRYELRKPLALSDTESARAFVVALARRHEKDRGIGEGNP